MNDREISQITHCILFIGITNPATSELLAGEIEKFTILINSLEKVIRPVILQHGGEIAKMVDEGFECHFIQTSDPNNVRAMKDVLECCFKLVENQEQLSMGLKSKGFSDVSCKVAVDYERRTLRTDLILDKPPVWCAAYGIFMNNLPYALVAGEDLVKIITNLSDLKGLYHFEKLGKYQLEDKSEDYAIYSITRGNNNHIYL